MADKSQKIVVGAPEDLLVNDENNLSRALSLADRAVEVKQRAVDIFDNGQTQPVRCYPGRGAKPVVYIGFTRAAAVQMIRDGFQVPTGEVETVPGEKEGETVERPVFRTIRDENFPLSYVVDEITEAEADIRGLADNYQNNKPNDLDLARSGKALQDKHGLNDTQITQLLNISDPFKFGRVKKLLRAPSFVQEAVQAGTLATSAALTALDAEGEGRTAAMALIKEKAAEGKAPTQGQVKKAINDAGSTDGTQARPSARTGSEIRNDFTVLESELQNDATIPAEYVLFVGETLRYLNGKITFKTLTKKYDEAFGVKPAKKGGGRKKGGPAAKDEPKDEPAEAEAA